MRVRRGFESHMEQVSSGCSQEVRRELWVLEIRQFDSGHPDSWLMVT